MPAPFTSSRSRPANPAASAPPPAKRPRHAHTGLKAAILAAGDGRKLTAVTTYGLKNASRHRVDDARAAVQRADGGGDVEMTDARQPQADQESDDSGSSDDESADDEEVVTPGGRPNGIEQSEATVKPAVNGWKKPSGVDEVDDDGDEPTFGELLHSHLQEPIDVEASFALPTEESTAVAHISGRNLTAPTATSLGTVLTQALRTNDRELLESCFEMNDLDGVRATIERLPSNMVANLLHTLAERMHRRPGRAGSLMVWIQWSLVAHGGYIASQPQLTAKLRSLKRVIAERAHGLQPLLELKGKLDMLAAQMDLRRQMQASSARGFDEDEDAVIYVEGEEDKSDTGDEEEEEEEAWHSRKPRRRAEQEEAEGQPKEEDSDSFMPLTVNGISSDRAESDDSEDEEDLVDDEAEEGSAEETEEDEDDDEVDEEGEDVLSEEDMAGPSRRSTAARSGFVTNR